VANETETVKNGGKSMNKISLRTILHLFATIALALLLVFAQGWGIPTAGAGSGKSTSPNVTTIVHDTDSTGAALLLKSDDYNGSFQATYSAALNPGVGSFLTSDGRFFLDLFGQSARMLFITPNSPINGSQPMAPPPGYYWQNVELAVGCHDQNGNGVAFPNIVNFTGNCSMILDFNYNGTKYKLAMGPNGNLPSSDSGSGLVNVACNSVSDGMCVSWTITPNMTPSSINPPTVANLYVFTNNHKTPLALVGQYYQTFRIDVTNP
jgi:hypothetical protein